MLIETSMPVLGSWSGLHPQGHFTPLVLPAQIGLMSAISKRTLRDALVFVAAMKWPSAGNHGKVNAKSKLTNCVD